MVAKSTGEMAAISSQFIVELVRSSLATTISAVWPQLPTNSKVTGNSVRTGTGSAPIIPGVKPHDSAH